MRHRDHRIHRCHEKRCLRCSRQLLGGMHHQMTACRESHTADTIRPDAIVRSMSSHFIECPAQVIEAFGETPLFQIHMEGERCPASMTVLYDKGCNAVITKPLGHLITLTLLIQPEIAATRTDDDPRPRRILLGDESPEPIGMRREDYQ